MLSAISNRTNFGKRNKGAIVILFIFISTSLFSQIDDEIVFLQVDTEWTNQVEKEAPKLEILEDIRINDSLTPERTQKLTQNKIIKKSSQITIDHNSVVQSYIAKYKGYSWFNDVLSIYDFYEPLFEAKLKEHGLPTELKYLPIVESAMNAKAKSHAGAMGLWQFMPATGREYGLINNGKINTFYDPVHSTEAACKYLKYLYSLFKDWNLVLSAYNSGQGTVLNAIKKAGTKDYWTVRKYLPSETKAYTPSFHAVKYLSENRKEHSINVRSYFMDFNSVKIIKSNSPINLESYAKRENKRLDVLYFLNPQIVRGSKYIYIY